MPWCELCVKVGIANCDLCLECGFHHLKSSGHANRRRLAASYECMRCQHRYRAASGMTQCPKCKSIYVVWLDWAGTGSVKR